MLVSVISYLLLIISYYLLWKDVGIVIAVWIIASLLYFMDGLRLKWYEGLVIYWGTAWAIYHFYVNPIEKWLRINSYDLGLLTRHPEKIFSYKLLLGQSFALAGASIVIALLIRVVLNIRDRRKASISIEMSSSSVEMPLGVNTLTGEQVSFNDEDANLHTLILGTTGSGKTNTICNIIENAVTQGSPLFYVDGKGDLELAQQINHFAIKHNRPFYLFSMVGESCFYNPLHIGGATSRKDRIIELRDWSEDYYRKLAEGYLQTVFNILEVAGIDVDLAVLPQYMKQDALYMLIREHNLPHLKEMVDSLSDAEKHIDSLRSELQTFIQSDIGKLFHTWGEERNVLTLPSALEENAIVYFCLQPLAFPSYANAIGKLIINDIKALAASQLSQKEKKPLYCIFDEFSVFAGNQVVNLINQGRSAGIRGVLATQTLSDLSAANGQPFVTQVLSNCNNYIIHRLNSSEDADIMASVASTRPSSAFTIQFTEDSESNPGTVKQTREFIIHPDEIKHLGLGEAVLVTKREFSVNRIHINKSNIL